MHLPTFLLYLATWTLVALTPGPAVMYAMAQGVRRGLRGAALGVAGVQLGNFLFFAVVASGLGTLLAAATGWFTILRLVGAIYLCYLGGRMILRSFRDQPSAGATAATPAVTNRRVFLGGLLLQLTNPKALLFVSALLPQFLDPARPAAGQLAILVTATAAVDTLVLMLYATLACRGAHTLRSTQAVRILERFFGAALVLCGCRLLVSRR